MKKGDIVEGIITEYGFPNKAYMKVEDKRVLVKGALPGEEVSARITKNRSEKAEALLLSVLKKGELEDREPICPHFGICGGCTYQTMSYENQLKLKEDMIHGMLDSVVKDEYNWDGILKSPLTEGYRNKMEFSFGDEVKDGPLSLGMHKKGSFHDIVTVSECKIVHPDFTAILKVIRDFYAERKVPFFHRMSHEGILRHLILRRSFADGALLINLVTSTQYRADGSEDISDGVYRCGVLALDELSKVLNSLKLFGRIAGFIHTQNDSMADAVIPERVVTVFGEDSIYEEILGLRFRISPFSFFQTNTKGCEVLYEKAREYVGETKDKVIFDLYSGTGTIAQMLAPVAKKVVGVEIIEEAVVAARENAKLNGLDNCEFIAGDVLKKIDEIEDKPDLIVLDPPRDGINPKALGKIIDFGVKNLVYISCKPSSLVRDLVTLQARGYRVTRAVAVDQFVNTVHTETICLLEQYDKK